MTDHLVSRRNTAVIAPTAAFRSNALMGALAVGALTAGPGMVMASSDGTAVAAEPESSMWGTPSPTSATPAAVTIELPTSAPLSAPSAEADLTALQKGAAIAQAAAERAEAEKRAAQEAAEEAERLRVLAEMGGANCPSTGFGGVAATVAKAGHHLQDLFGIDDVGGVASRPNNPSSDHPHGYALDFMVDTATGNELASYARAHTQELGIKYILWQVPAHYDHVHISFNRAPAKGLPCQ